MQQDYSFKSIRSSLVLTNSYVAGTVLSYDNLNPALRNQLNIYVDFTIGSLTDGRIKVEYSDDGSDYYQDTFADVATGVATMTAGYYKFTGTGKYVISIPIKASYIKISALGTGTVTSSLMKIGAVVGTA